MADEVVGNYKLQNLMMSGQTSQVWEVVEKTSHRHFAMKILLPEKTGDEECVKSIIHEGSVGKKLAHPFIIKIVHFSKSPKNPYFVMEYFPAGSLKLRMLRKQAEFVKGFADKILKDAATAFAYMNSSGWVHRDVKPDNILVNSAGEVRIIDFALAKRIEKPNFFSNLMKKISKQVNQTTQGTRSYMSPEQIRSENLDGRADIYSFGATAYEIAAGRPPFVAADSTALLTKHLVEKPLTPKSHNPDLTDDFCDLVLHMLKKKREDRPKNFHEVLMSLKTLKIYKR